jgi:hypothetical protein
MSDMISSTARFSSSSEMQGLLVPEVRPVPGARNEAALRATEVLLALVISACSLHHRHELNWSCAPTIRDQVHPQTRSIRGQPITVGS